MRAPALALAVGALALAPATGRAQRPGSAAADSAGGPPCARRVADGTRVRLRLAVDGTRHTGVALGWATPTPRLVTARGDTIVLVRADERHVSMGRTGRRTLQGALVGWFAGVLTGAGCFGERTCGEQNPFPLIGTALGAAVGHRLRRERWKRVHDDPTCPGGRP